MNKRALWDVASETFDQAYGSEAGWARLRPHEQVLHTLLPAMHTIGMQPDFTRLFDEGFDGIGTAAALEMIGCRKGSATVRWAFLLYHVDPGHPDLRMLGLYFAGTRDEVYRLLGDYILAHRTGN
jgi:hypothetical protein